jgi:N-acetylglucosamine malate deacetylase 1
VTNASVLAVFAHPDDAELSCFGTLARLGAAGFDLHVLALTNGANSCSPDAAFRPVEAKESAAVIGADLVIEGFLDGGLEPYRETYACVEAHLARVRPSVVITHRVGALDHQDHETAGRAATTMATRSRFAKLILHAEPPLMNNLFRPNVYVDITEQMPDKLSAIARYRSESGKPYVAAQAIRDRGTWWARQAAGNNLAHIQYCEAFYLCKATVDAGLTAVLGQLGRRTGPAA